MDDAIDAGMGKAAYKEVSRIAIYFPIGNISPVLAVK